MSTMTLPAKGRDLNSLTYKELQRECRKANLKATGPAKQLRERLHENLQSEKTISSEFSESPKKNSAAVDDLICPITLALLFDPVVAEDGRIYERSAIEQHIKTMQESSSALKSPVTNEPMGPRLFPTHPIRSLIERMVDNDEIQGELLDAWKEKQKEKKDFEEDKAKAENGNVVAMRYLGSLYFFGEKGAKIDLLLANQWLQKASDLGDIPSMAMLGILFPSRNSVALVSMAAEGGSRVACLKLGMWLASGTEGLDVNNSHAIRLLRKGLDPTACKHHNVTQSFMEKCKKKLEELESNSRS